MATKPNNKSVGIAHGDKELSGNLLRAALFKVNFDGSIINDSSNESGIFLLNPSSWDENKSSIWAAHSIPGQSDPVHQWVSGGPRTVSFTALVTKETSNFIPDKNDIMNFVANINKFSSEIASAFFGINNSNVGDISPSKTETGRLNINSYLNYYRSLLYPAYDGKNKRLKASPPLVVLITGGAIEKFKTTGHINTESDVWFVSNINIKITKQLSNLVPIEASVDFQLVQYIMKPFSETRFSNNSNSRK